MANARKERSIIEVDRSNRGDSQAEAGSRKYIAVAGNIGSGKSSLVEFLSSYYGISPYFEPNEDNPYLKDFYGDMKRWSFHSQIYFLAAKFRIHQHLDQLDQSVVQDRTIWEDAEIFAENLYRQRRMSKRDYGTYRLVYESIRDRIRPPDLMIYLRCPVATVRKRIAIRGRRMESDIPVGYLRRLHHLYEAWIENYALSPLVIIPTHRLDYVTDLVDRHDITTTFEKYLAP